MPNILFAAKSERWETYEAPLREALSDLGVAGAWLGTQADPSEIDYLVYAPNSGLVDFTPYTSLKAVLNLWAGVEDVVGNPTLNVPLARMVDPGLEEGMVEWVTGHVLRHHLGIDQHIAGQDGVWRLGAPPLARDRVVTILGLGELGQACARILAGLNFQVRGWARSAKAVPNVTSFSGADEFEQALDGADIVVLLLPDTPATHNILDADAIAHLAPGAFVINPGRGPLIDDQALIAALDTGHLAHATLDTFRQEPLPPEHPFWAHPGITVTPHIASETRAKSAARVIAENIRRGEAGEPFLHLVDVARGY
ncbi:MAG: glyoxylate/hydroxypyruvate reductase A [Pseudomonadota bacterium]